VSGSISPKYCRSSNIWTPYNLKFSKTRLILTAKYFYTQNSNWILSRQSDTSNSHPLHVQQPLIHLQSSEFTCFIDKIDSKLIGINSKYLNLFIHNLNIIAHRQEIELRDSQFNVNPKWSGNSYTGKIKKLFAQASCLNVHFNQVTSPSEKEKKGRQKEENERDLECLSTGNEYSFCNQHSKKKNEGKRQYASWKGANCHFKIEMNHSDKCRQSGNDGMGGSGGGGRKELLIEFNASCAIWPKLLRKFTSLTAIIISPCIYIPLVFFIHIMRDWDCKFCTLQLIVIMIWWWCWWWW